MNLITWVLLGAIAGVIANVIDPSPARGGLLGAIILGIVGAIVGGFLSTLIFGIGVTGIDISSVAISAVGALLLLYFSRAIRTT